MRMQVRCMNAADAADAYDAYGQRWEIETAFTELETGIRGGPAVVLRSKSPDMNAIAARVTGAAAFSPS